MIMIQGCQNARRSRHAKNVRVLSIAAGALRREVVCQLARFLRQIAEARSSSFLALLRLFQVRVCPVEGFCMCEDCNALNAENRLVGNLYVESDEAFGGGHLSVSGPSASSTQIFELLLVSYSKVDPGVKLLFESNCCL